jgi:Tol biopolymer transport system component
MTCEKAEEFLSAYLDDMLAPQLRQEVAAHVEGCTSCEGILSDYRRYDSLLAMDRRVEPPLELRARIFDSPEFAAILAEQRDADAPAAPHLPRRIGASPGWVRGAVAAAVAVLLFGSALLIKQGLLTSGTPGTRITTPLAGNTGTKPLAAGNRVVFARGGSLWSAPEQGASLADQLTPVGVHVGAWSVAPDGKHVAYVDAATGRIHVIRSDDQNDLATYSVSITTSEASLVWSPDGQRIAYLAARPGDSPMLRIVNADGTNDIPVNADSGAVTGTLVWSPDGSFLAYLAHGAGGNTFESVWIYNTAQHTHYQLAPADPTDAQAQVLAGNLHWLADTQHPVVTWAASDGERITGVFSQGALVGTQPQRLKSAGRTYSAADFSATYAGGAWLVSSADAPATLSLVSASGGASRTLETGVAYAHIAWSPGGDTAALVSHDGALSLWSAAGVRSAVGGGVLGMPVWAPDGQRVVVGADNGLIVLHLRNGAVSAVTRLATAGQVTGIVLASDGKGLAIATSSGVTLYADESGQPKMIVGAADAGALAWSVAG